MNFGRCCYGQVNPVRRAIAADRATAAHPPTVAPGRASAHERSSGLTGILYVLHTCVPCEYLPRQRGCGSGVTCWWRLRDWQRAGEWQRFHVRRCTSQAIKTRSSVHAAALSRPAPLTHWEANTRAPILRTGENLVVSTASSSISGGRRWWPSCRG
jgi:transposase